MKEGTARPPGRQVFPSPLGAWLLSFLGARRQALPVVQDTFQGTVMSQSFPASLASLEAWLAPCHQSSSESLRDWDRDPMMLLACLFSISIIASCAVKTNRAERSRAQPPAFNRHSSLREGNDEVGASPEDDRLNKGDAEENYNVVRRALRRYPEEAEHRDYGHHHMDVEHQQASLQSSRSDCDCPEVLTKGTLIAIVAALAFLGFFSSSILLGVAICILRLVAKQRKKDKDEKLHSSHRRSRPPIPPPRPEHTYMPLKAQGYERLHTASQHATQGVYLRPSELHPGPRIHQEKRYQNVSRSPQGSKSTPENEYITPHQVPTYSTPPLESKYVNMEELQPKSQYEGSPGGVASPKRRETHLYEEVE